MDTAGDDRTVAAANLCAHRADHGLVDQDDGGAPPSPAAKPSHSMHGGFAANHTGRRSRAGGAGAGSAAVLRLVGTPSVALAVGIGAALFGRSYIVHASVHVVFRWPGAPSLTAVRVSPRLPLTVLLYNSY